MSDITYRLVKGTELTFGELDRNFGSLDSDIVALIARFDSLAVGGGLVIDTVEPVDPSDGQMWLDPADDFVRIWDGANWFEFPNPGSYTALDSADVTNLIDSDYIGNIIGEHWDSAKTIQLLDEKGVQNIIPVADSAYDLGTPSLRWRDLHLSGNTIHLGPLDIKSGLGGVYVDDRRLAFDDSSVDSAQVVGIIDSYVDSAFIRLRADSDYIKSAADSDHIKFIADSAYVTRIAEDVGLDSAKLVRFLDSESRHIIPLDGETYDLGTNLKRWRNIYVKDLFVSPATIHFSDSAETPQSTLSLDSDGEFKLTTPSGSGYVSTSSTPVASGPTMIAGGRLLTAYNYIQTDSSTPHYFGFFDSGQGPGGTDGITRLAAGRYKFRFDSANLNRISSSRDYSVMLTYDYGADNPTASSRVANVFFQGDSGFQVLIERADDGSNEDYASAYAYLNFQVWLY